MELNRKKCGILVVRQDRRTPALIEKEIDGIGITESYQYLGVKIDDCLRFDFELEAKTEMLRKLEKASHILWKE